MSDEDLRQHERRFRHTGSACDEAVYLQALLRAGRVEQCDLELAAYLGHEPAFMACEEGITSPQEPREWISGLESYGGDLAIWAAAEAALVDDPSGAEYYGVLRGEAQERLRAGALEPRLEGILLGSAEGPNPVYAKLFCLVLQDSAQDPRFLPLDHPEVQAALGRIVERFPILRAERWAYDRVERNREGAWVHVLRYRRSDATETRHTVAAAEGWEPPDGFRSPPRGRRGVFGHYSFGFSSEGIEAARRALLPQALAVLWGSTRSDAAAQPLLEEALKRDDLPESLRRDLADLVEADCQVAYQEAQEEETD